MVHSSHVLFSPPLTTSEQAVSIFCGEKANIQRDEMTCQILCHPSKWQKPRFKFLFEFTKVSRPFLLFYLFFPYESFATCLQNSKNSAIKASETFESSTGPLILSEREARTGHPVSQRLEAGPILRSWWVTRWSTRSSRWN